MKALAVGHRIVVQPLEKPDSVVNSARASGLIVKETSVRDKKNQMNKGTVIAIGPEAFKAYGDSVWCRVGDLIVYPKNAGAFVVLSADPEDDDEDLTHTVLVINDEDVVTVLKED